MKINSVMLNFKANFKVEAKEVSGYDDEVSQKKREQIRRYQQTKYFAYQDIFEKEGGRLSDFDLKALIKKFKNVPKVVDFDEVDALPISNLCMVGKNSFRGESLVDFPRALPVLKKRELKELLI